MFTFDGCKIEYTLGFCYYEKEDTFLVGYSKLDKILITILFPKTL